MENLCLEEGSSQILLNLIASKKSRRYCDGQCRLCNQKSSAYYCKDCLNIGNFFHSHMKYPDRYADKLLLSHRLTDKFATYSKNAKLRAWVRREALEREILDTKERIDEYKQAISEKKVALEEIVNDVATHYELFHRMNTNKPIFLNKITTLKDNAIILSAQSKRKRADLSLSEGRLKCHVGTHVDLLCRYIIPIMEVPSESDDRDNVDSTDDTVLALAEACQTNYIKGRWVRTTTPTVVTDRRHYKLLASTLPESGIYVNKNEDSGIDEEARKKQTQNICAGLSFLAQLVSTIAYIARVNLPKRVTFNDFYNLSSEDIRNKKFEYAVMKLNVNVLALCSSQGIPAPKLQPLRAVSNILLLLNEYKNNLGRQGRFSFCENLACRIEDEMRLLSLSDSESDEEVSLCEWETLSNQGVAHAQTDPMETSFISSTATSLWGMLYRYTGSPK